MSKDNRKNKKGGSLENVSRITRALTKKGRIKGKDKKETKELRAVCPHHTLTKKGKLRAQISQLNGEFVECELCEARIKTKPYTDDELYKIVENMEDIVNQAKFFIAAANLGRDAEKYMASLAILLMSFPKTYKKIRKIVKKADDVGKNKKNRNRNSDGGSERFGVWQ